MQLIDAITSESKQHFKFQATLNDEVDIYLTWRDTQNAWFMEMICGTKLSIYGMKVIAAANILSQFSRKIDFGISITPNELQDPLIIDSFASGSWLFIFLDAADIAKYEAIYG